MNKKILKNKKGGLSVVISSVIGISFLLIIIAKIIINGASSNTKILAQNIIQQELKTICATQKITLETCDFYEEKLYKYKGILKNYDINFTVYKIDGNTGKFDVIKKINSKDITTDIPLEQYNYIEIDLNQTEKNILQSNPMNIQLGTFTF